MRQQPLKSSGKSGSKAIALDQRAKMARLRLWLLLSTFIAAASAIGLQFAFHTW